ncbi:glutamine-hydrolyzing carbamoyl-phosphate synthase small subunit [Woodsholea maritima]|uniref:glutamine-hydrolyzing carbamoyl-phosphate synthase small subunit n=1 Tax=Woodsholea maritima TaxID=240237 RepID=UPI000363D0D1|nr:glutamine-hydrolyzing carbamoyl-phosphate synthase small subunit [Woodsholea maritima]
MPDTIKNQDQDRSTLTTSPLATGLIVLSDGTVYRGFGAGTTGQALGEVCFNTAMTGHQEILADPSYAGQILCFTFPHIGNVGANSEDEEASCGRAQRAAVGMIAKSEITAPANWRASQTFNEWLLTRGIIAVTGVDTRALTRKLRVEGMQIAAIAHAKDGHFDIEALKALAKNAPTMEGKELARDVTREEAGDWKEGDWDWPNGFKNGPEDGPKVVVLDYGVKSNILRRLTSAGAHVVVKPGSASAEEVLAENPDGVVVSNGPGDPAATGEYALETLRALLDKNIPMLGICLGHQMLALALGAKTLKMAQGHHGANHPVKNFDTGQVEIVSMNHGFAVDGDSLPANAQQTHISLFDGTNCGFKLNDKPVFAVQHHPEASPGPQDSFNVFEGFIEAIKAR